MGGIKLQSALLICGAAVTMLSCSEQAGTPGPSFLPSGTANTRGGNSAQENTVGASGGYRHASPNYQLRFPEDHAPHPGYRTEWWYYTGHLFAEGTNTAQRGTPADYGYQITIFKVETVPNLEGARAAPNVFYVLHAAISDRAMKKFYHAQTLQRDFPGMAGYEADGRLWVEKNWIQIVGNRHTLEFYVEGSRLRIDLSGQLPPVLHGSNGYSRKAPGNQHASMYYSSVGLRGTASLWRGGREQKLAASGWLDREFGSSVLASNQQGWDWLAVSLSDGSHIMAVEIRSPDAPFFRFGSIVGPGGKSRPLRDFTLDGLNRWHSPRSGAVYPTNRRLLAPNIDLEVRSWFPDQEQNAGELGITYWEGAVDVSGRHKGKAVTGQGYLEMTGYAQALNGRL